ncbi:MAG: AI-2E family transporter [Spirochaetaceae bacterium]|jgi:predicted PurR-regulated permease PerM|nr:AI-2E family transporter [Spirochaetaceae bacterium]
MARSMRFSRMMLAAMLFIVVIIVFAILKVTAPVTLPIVTAIFLALVFEPIVRFLKEKFHIPWICGIFLVIILCFAAISMVLTLLISSARSIVAVYPNYEAKALRVYRELAGFFRLPFDAEVGLFTNLWNQFGFRSFVQSSARTFSGSLVTFSKNVFLVTLFVAFLLVEIRAFRIKLSAAFPNAGEGRVMGIINDTIHQVTRYLSIKFFISLLTGICVFAGTFAVGLDFAIVWGFLAFALNFIPNFGSIASGVITTGFSILQFWPLPGKMVIVGSIMLGVNMILGNMIEPRIQGRSLGLSPFLILVSLSIWGWIWGFAGLIFAVPMMAILKIVCENVDMLRPFAIIMGSTIREKAEG